MAIMYCSACFDLTTPSRNAMPPAIRFNGSEGQVVTGPFGGISHRVFDLLPNALVRSDRARPMS